MYIGLAINKEIVITDPHIKWKISWAWYEGNIRNHHECESGIEKSIPRILDCDQEVCQVMPISDREGRTFLSHHHTSNGLFFLAHHYMKRIFQKTLNSLRCDMMASF